MRGGKILVVDDEISLQETLVYNLSKEGYTVEVAGDGNQALELARSSKPDLVILDVMLPGLDGFEVPPTKPRGKHSGINAHQPG